MLFVTDVIDFNGLCESSLTLILASAVKLYITSPFYSTLWWSLIVCLGVHNYSYNTASVPVPVPVTVILPVPVSDLTLTDQCKSTPTPVNDIDIDWKE